jgi:hypothetical protein
MGLISRIKERREKKKQEQAKAKQPTITTAPAGTIQYLQKKGDTITYNQDKSSTKVSSNEPKYGYKKSGKERKTATLKQARENLPDTTLGKIAKVASSPHLTGALATSLASLGMGAAIGAGAAGKSILASGLTRSVAGRGTTAVIARTATIGRNTMTTQRAFIGRPAVTKQVAKLFTGTSSRSAGRTALRYATNNKSTSLTTSLIKKVGLGAALVGVIGSYPFAGFIKEEALQTIDFGIKSALDNGDLNSYEEALIQKEEILNEEGWEKLLNAIPYVNILSKLKQFYTTSRLKLEIDKRVFELISRGEVSDAEKIRRNEEGDYYGKIAEANKQRKLEDLSWEAQYYALIREGKYEEAQEMLELEMKGG